MKVFNLRLINKKHTVKVENRFKSITIKRNGLFILEVLIKKQRYFVDGSNNNIIIINIHVFLRV